jgi:hypothetical protein
MAGIHPKIGELPKLYGSYVQLNSKRKMTNTQTNNSK